ncbi:DUF1365 domain-containing protein [Oxalobacteraceae bacterium]|nr:DUF1365 domain-containing protein [Oxalobacteraceae bacterium]
MRPDAAHGADSAATPELCFGQVRHTRLRPLHNAFHYGVYFLRLPLRTLGGAGFASRLCSRNRFNLLSFHDRDHGDGRQALPDWIDGLLREQGIADADGEIWLQTMPRVLGYVFNPVSLWFCHRRDGALRAVLCDVRNTFGERHFYLLDSAAGIAAGQELSARKVFHVSPFCAVEGGYRFRFFAPPPAGTAQARKLVCIDYDDLAGPLLRTRWSGRAGPVSDGAVARAFFGYPLMTLGVIVRIHWQALRLWLGRVPLFSKPLPPQQKVTR